MHYLLLLFVGCWSYTESFSAKGGFGMRIRQTCAYMMIVGGMLLFSGGAVQAGQSSSGTPSGGTMGSGSGTGSGSAGGSSGSMRSDQKQGHESSGKMGVEPYGQTDTPKTGGESTLGGSGRIPDSSQTTPGKGSSGGSGSGMGSGSGSMGSSGGTGSSGGGSGH